MADCRYCDATGLVWGTTKKGGRALYELRAHVAYCKGRRQPSPLQQKKAALDKETREALVELYGKARAPALFRKVRGDTFDERMLSAFGIVNKEAR